MPRPQSLLALAAFGTILGTALPGGRAEAEPPRAPIAFGPTHTVLTLIPGAEASQALGANRPTLIDAGGAAEAALLRDCANGESQQAARGFLWSVVTGAWRVLLHPLAVDVHEQLLKYASVSEATASADYYRASETPGAAAPGAPGPGAAAPVESRISCLRFTRFISADPQAGEVALDFVASLRLDAARDAIRLRPLRLYLDKASARSANGHYAVAISVRADAVWRDEFTGHQSQVFEQTLLSEGVDLRAGSYLKYYPPDAPGTRVLIIPISFGVDRSHDFGRAEFGVSVAELGTPPATLTLLSELLPDPDEKFAQLLVDAALAGIGLH